MALARDLTSANSIYSRHAVKGLKHPYRPLHCLLSSSLQVRVALTAPVVGEEVVKLRSGPQAPPLARRRSSGTRQAAGARRLAA